MISNRQQLVNDFIEYEAKQKALAEERMNEAEELEEDTIEHFCFWVLNLGVTDFWLSGTRPRYNPIEDDCYKFPNELKGDEYRVVVQPRVSGEELDMDYDLDEDWQFNEVVTIINASKDYSNSCLWFSPNSSGNVELEFSVFFKEVPTKAQILYQAYLYLKFCFFTVFQGFKGAKDDIKTLTENPKELGEMLDMTGIEISNNNLEQLVHICRRFYLDTKVVDELMEYVEQHIKDEWRLKDFLQWIGL